MAAPRSAPDAVAAAAVSGGAAVAVAVASRAQAAVATSPDAGQQLALSPAGGDHVTTVARPQKVDVAALRSPDAVATNTTSEGYRRGRSPQQSQSRGGRARPSAQQQGGSSEPRVRRMVAEGTVVMGTFTARESAAGTSATRTSVTREQTRQGGEPRERARDERPNTATGAGDNASRERTFPGLCGRSICTLCSFEHRKE